MQKHIRNNLFVRSVVFAAASLLLSHAALPQASETSRMEAAAANAMQRKIDFVDRNGHSPRPSTQPTVFLQNEINSYFQERRVKMPQGVQSVVWALETDTATARTRVDFDELMAGRQSNNPLLSMFSGTHDVEVVARATASNGMAHVRVESASLDGINIPRRVLEMFIERYVQPKYPNVALENDYKLPVRIDSVLIQDRKATITQR